MRFPALLVVLTLWSCAQPPTREVEMAADREELEEIRRLEIPMLPPGKRIKGFMEVESGYSEEQAMEEAKRCLRCDLETS